MESNECICLNLISRLQSALDSILSTTATTIMNRNTPATDSGYINNNSQVLPERNMINLNTIFYSVLIMVALLIMLSKLLQKNKSKC